MSEGILDVGEELPFQEPVAANREQRTATPKEPKDVPSTVFRFRMLNDFVDKTLRQLKNKAAALVWFILWRNASKGVVNISHKRIADLSGYSQSAVKRAMRTLREQGLVRVRWKGNSYGANSEYTLRAVISQGGEAAA